MSTLKHLAIIPDGNRRWAKAKGLAAVKGHEFVKDTLLDLLIQAKKKHITYFSLWVFSTDNWKRPETEKKALFNIFKEFNKYEESFIKEHIQVRWAGRRDRVPQEVREVLEKLIEHTKNFDAMTLQVCLDYGGRDELLRVTNKAISAGKQLTAQDFAQLLDTATIPDPDLILRTSGEQRLSGFMPWQSAHSELLFIDKQFPDFTPADITAACAEFSKRQRRYGGN